jgi:hypothetical protein
MEESQGQERRGGRDSGRNMPLAQPASEATDPYNGLFVFVRGVACDQSLVMMNSGAPSKS